MNKLVKPLLIVAGFVTVLAIFFAGFYLRPKYDARQLEQSSAVAEEFVEKITSGDNDGAYALTSSTLQEKQNKEAFVEAVGNLKSDNAELQEPEAIRNDDTVIYYQRVLNLPETSKGSTVGVFYVTLAKDGGNWKVSTVTVQ